MSSDPDPNGEWPPMDRDQRRSRRMMIDETDPAERLARIELLVDEYRLVKHRRIVRRAMKLRRAAEAHQRLAKFEAVPERVH